MDEFELRIEPDAGLEDQLVDQLVAYNQSRSTAVQERFEPANLKSEPVQVFALGPDGALRGGCVGRVERVWHWLTIDTMWVDDTTRGQGLGSALLRSIEEEGRRRGCQWSDVTTFDFQAPDFYRKAGYLEYGVKHDYPPGHTNYFFRKDLMSR
ncbi:GNAT family N-acetyltransferase [Kribbella sp. NPDC058693]|uniref:GNAT family N-acetyltransferase n=1 Tax=Kribbella sp. NPDC058693 TaxID=3346602 RepID=UPI0036669B52